MHYLDVDPFSIILRTSNSLTFKPTTTKDVITTQNQCQIWIYLKTTCCVQLNMALWDRVNLNCTEILKADTLKLQQLWKKLLSFWADISHKRATSSTGIRANWINCLLYILKVLLYSHSFPLLNINCTEPYLGPLYRSYIIVQILKCKIPESLTGGICKRFSKVSRRWRCEACHVPLPSFYLQ